MRLGLTLFLMAAACHAQQAAIERGAQLFRTQCATPYCHGPEGTAGRAPRLAGHRFNVNQMFKVITWGIPGTGMPEFTTRLKTQEIADLVAYVMTLAGTGPAPATAPAGPPRALTPEARQGRALFFDAARTGNCGSCHDLDGWGVPVGPGLAGLPPNRIGDLRTVSTRSVMTARPKGEPPFPALLVDRTEARVRVYDLTGPLPVLRTFSPARIELEPGTPWGHEHATRVYTSADLATIAQFLAGQ